VSTRGLPPRRDETPAAAVSLEPRRRELAAQVAELQWDLGGLVYEMAIRDHIRVDLLIQRAAAMQALDAELGEVERVMRMDQAGAAGACPSCTALHSRGAAFCWQCGHSLVEQVRTTPTADRAAEA
jgi:chorismate mutase